MTAAVLTHLTFEEFERLPDQVGKLELLRGELIDMPPAKRKHNETAHRILFFLCRLLEDLHARGEAGQLGSVWHEMGYRMGARSWLQPDVSITHPNQESGDYYVGAPAVAIEVISEGNTADAVEGKVAEYLAHGAIEVWVVYPKRGHLWVYTPNGAAAMHKTPFRSAILADALVDVAAFLL